ncbi:phosphate ABC transporter permease PstA [Komagataeibacter sucrofermentans]|uniref:Phosphate transport system permease protein PstA n=1 Tax=Komagataeibacter sucrofermentans TaxID=1053551 RepID=A0A318QIZ5_9PROT|nr:phosphate ABC transporter permease PstA [Komagataeibacter sucrofermentans]PYD79496.1 phosphate ABC transporter, permease protein PstA [Komagataeibacter sucrofermentans]GBQ46693.1 phosphate ABC transporter permease [Komagataeibacter sucrofermentans DSM 15973]
MATHPTTPTVQAAPCAGARWQGNSVSDIRRRMVDRVATTLCWAATVLVLLMLFSILFVLVRNGVGGLRWVTFVHVTLPPGQAGGLANAIVGSLIQTGLAVLIGAPVGLLVGIYLAEFTATDGKLINFVRFVSDLLLSAPSILVGLFIYMIVVVPSGHFSGLAGALALSMLVVPVVVRTTEDMLRLVPLAMREAAIALGAPRWRMILFVCLRAAREGVATGILLALARVSGETAPLLFTSLGNMNWSIAPGKPMASLPVTIYQYAGAAYADWTALAWTGALLITTGILMINITVRLGLGRNRK